ncbi:MAG: Uncharacterized protein FD165_2542 [Gammaproteobacteria bacterium]|nr:MAG: Uncharacterized protein FD165_2542 [Gammaproteobacteria bacterium]TND02979.1 MAG: Uncharacterized protein FD120_2048 [Gammaproteobacteria bacterium]
MTLSCGCPEQYPDWHEQDMDLGGQPVHTLSIPTLIHMPLAYEAYLARQQRLIESLGLDEQWPRLVLTRTGVFRGAIMRLLKPTTSPAPRITIMPRPFNVRAVLHHGDIGTIRKTVQAMQMALVDAGKVPKELYLCHLTCPHCRDDRGGDKMLLLRRWQESPSLARRLRTKSPVSF